MESRMRKNVRTIAHTYQPPFIKGEKLTEYVYEHRRSFSGGLTTAKKPLRPSYLSMESMLLLIGLTASLLILPLVLPTLPPAPFLLLLVPIGILGLLVMIAFMPSNVRDLTYTYM